MRLDVTIRLLWHDVVKVSTRHNMHTCTCGAINVRHTIIHSANKRITVIKPKIIYLLRDLPNARIDHNDELNIATVCHA